MCECVFELLCIMRHPAVVLKVRPASTFERMHRAPGQPVSVHCFQKATTWITAPWDINIDLPYGTMSDAEMRGLALKSLQTDGYLFLWVTGRAMELGRELLAEWGYRRCSELVWIKTNQLQTLIRTGRTGHFLNHSKEHCLVGVKGDPGKLRFAAGGDDSASQQPRQQRGRETSLDCDVIVSEVRETSRKPDAIYGIIERLCPGTRKCELFGRRNNTQPGWITLGNQLRGNRVVDGEMAARIRAVYPGMQM